MITSTILYVLITFTGIDCILYGRDKEKSHLSFSCLRDFCMFVNILIILTIERTLIALGVDIP